jgi:hypothetical protein
MSQGVPVLDDGLTTEEQAQGLVAVLSPSAGKVMLTNDVGVLLLDRCDGRRTEADLVAELRAAYPDVTEETARADVATFLSAAAGKGLLSWR